MSIHLAGKQRKCGFPWFEIPGGRFTVELKPVEVMADKAGTEMGSINLVLSSTAAD
jgi:hypothetical protein